MSALRLVPLKRCEANAYIVAHHRHHGPVTGDLFRVGISSDGELAGVAVVGRPVSRETQRQEPHTCELIRLCTADNAPRNAASMLLGAVRRAAWALGYTRLITYTLASERGSSLRAAGYRIVGERKGRSWSTPSRPRSDKHVIDDRLLWTAGLEGRRARAAGSVG